MNPARLPTLTDEVDLPGRAVEGETPVPFAEATLAPRVAYSAAPAPSEGAAPRGDDGEAALVERVLAALLERLEPLLREALHEAVARERASRDAH